MYNFILQTALMIGLGIMIYLVGRAVPRVSDDVSRPLIKTLRPFGGLTLEKIDLALNSFLEKTLRKAKLLILRLDNAISGYLDKIKKINGVDRKNGEDKPTLFENNIKEEEKTE
ncbi:MAG: hypothetical protein AAB411_00235 [Patescibacteria group bacterium]